MAKVTTTYELEVKADENGKPTGAIRVSRSGGHVVLEVLDAKGVSIGRAVEAGDDLKRLVKTLFPRGE